MSDFGLNNLQSCVSRPASPQACSHSDASRPNQCCRPLGGPAFMTLAGLRRPGNRPGGDLSWCCPSPDVAHGFDFLVRLTHKNLCVSLLTQRTRWRALDIINKVYSLIINYLNKYLMHNNTCVALVIHDIMTAQ